MQPFPRWVSWVFVGFLAYIIYTGNQASKPPESTPEEVAATTVPQTPSREYESLERLADGDRWFRAINPNFVGDANIKEITIGEGNAVQCGSDVELMLRGTDSNGANFDESYNESKPLVFTVGAAPIMALNEGVIGMKPGGVRQLITPANHVYKTREKRTLDDIKFHLTLAKTETLVTKDMPATAVTLQSGTEDQEPVRCGGKLAATITVFDDSGKRIYTSASPLNFTLGTHALAKGIDVMARGMLVGEERLLYLPPHYLKQNAKTDTELSAARQALSGKHLRVVAITRTE